MSYMHVKTSYYKALKKRSVNVTIVATVQHGLSYEIFEQKDSEGNSYCSQELQ